MRTLKRTAAAVTAFGILFAACSGDSATPSTSSEGTMAATSTTSEAPPPPATTTTSTSSTTTTIPIPPVVVWVDEPLAVILGGYAADFEAATGIPVSIEIVDTEDIVGLAIESFGTGAGPDVFFGSHRWVESLRVDGLIAEVPIWDPQAYLPVALAGFTSDGMTYGLPYYVETPGLYFNTSLVPEAPDGFTDLGGMCDALEITAQCLGIPSDDPAIPLALVTAFGGYGYGYGEQGLDTTDVGLDTEGGLAAADFVDAQARADALIPADTASTRFAEGDAAFQFGWPMSIPETIEWGAIPYRPAGASGPAAITEVYGFMINAASSQPVASQVFLTEFAGTDAPMFELFLSTFVGPARTRASEDAIRTDPRVAAFTPTDTTTSSLLPGGPAGDELLAALENAITVISSQQYTDATPDARTAFSQAAAVLRPAGSGG